MTIPMDEAVKYNWIRNRIERLEYKLEAVKKWAEKWIDKETTWSRGKALWKILEAED